VDASAAEDFRSHLFAVVADLASAVVAVGCPHRCPVVASADDFVVFDDDGSHGLFEACCPFFQHLADAQKIFVVGWSELPDDVLVMS